MESCVITSYDNRALTSEVVSLPKLARLLDMIRYLHERPRTVKQLMIIMDMSERQVYRYIATINQSGIYLDKDFNNRYFITQENCPICKQPKDQLTNVFAVR